MTDNDIECVLITVSSVCTYVCVSMLCTLQQPNIMSSDVTRGYERDGREGQDGGTTGDPGH